MAIKRIELKDRVVSFMTEATVEEVCFYSFESMLDMKHALQGANLFSVSKTIAGMEDCGFKIMELAPLYIKELFEAQ